MWGWNQLLAADAAEVIQVLVKRQLGGGQVGVAVVQLKEPKAARPARTLPPHPDACGSWSSAVLLPPTHPLQVSQLAQYFEPLVLAAVGAASKTINHQQQMNLLDQTKTLAESALQMLYTAKEAGGNPKVPAGSGGGGERVYGAKEGHPGLEVLSGLWLGGQHACVSSQGPLVLVCQAAPWPFRGLIPAPFLSKQPILRRPWRRLC